MKNRIRKIFLMLISAILVFSISACTKSLESQIAKQLELGEKYLTEGNYEEAIIALSKVIELDPKQIAVYGKLADAYEKQGNESEVQKILESAFEIIYKEYDKEDARFEESGTVIKSLAECYEKQELKEKVKELREKLAEIAPELESELFPPLVLSDEAKRMTENMVRFLYYEKAGINEICLTEELSREQTAGLLMMCLNEMFISGLRKLYGLNVFSIPVSEYSEMLAITQDEAKQFLFDTVGVELDSFDGIGDGTILEVQDDYIATFGGEWGLSWPFADIENYTDNKDGTITAVGQAGWISDEVELSDFDSDIIESVPFCAVLEKTDSKYLYGYTIREIEFTKE